MIVTARGIPLSYFFEPVIVKVPGQELIDAIDRMVCDGNTQVR